MVYQKMLKIVNWTFNLEPLWTIIRFWSFSQHIAWAQRQRKKAAENIDCLSSLSFYCLFFELWLFFVFLLFLFVISALLFLFWTPSAKSWLSRMQGSVVLIFAFSWCYGFLSVKSQSVHHPFVVAFVVRPLICSVLSLSWCLSTLWSLWFLSMLLNLNPPQLLSLQ